MRFARLVLVPMLWVCACAHGPRLGSTSYFVKKNLEKRDPQVRFRSTLGRVYSTRNYELFWLDPRRKKLIADLTRAIRSSAQIGLAPEDYHLKSLSKLLKKTDLAKEPDSAFLEILLADAFLTLAMDLKHGRLVPADVDKEWSSSKRRSTGVSLLQAFYGRAEPVVDEFLDGLEPKHPGYRRLREKYGEVYRYERSSLLNTLKANLERWRWLPEPMESQYIIVNIADETLTLVRDTTSVLSMDVVIGKPYRRTPLLSSRLKSIVINPDWTAPLTVFQQEFLPRFRKNPQAIPKKFSFYRDRGRSLDPIAPKEMLDLASRGIPIVMKERPGPYNPMGQIKFLFPNQHAIFLHDTPDRKQFLKPKRSAGGSAGCIRLSRPFDLASQVLGGRHGDPDLSSVRRKQVPTTIPINEEIGVHLVYITAWVTSKNNLQTRPDRYGRDALLLKRIQNKRGRF